MRVGGGRRPLALAALVLLLPLVARADDATFRKLMERATSVLREAEAHADAGRQDLAREAARRAAALVAQADLQRERDPNAAFLGVQAAVFAGDRALARTWMERYEQRTPYGERDPNLHYARAMVWLLLEGRPAEAVGSLDRMARLAPRGLSRPALILLYKALTAMGGALAEAGHVDEAVARFHRASTTARQLQDVRRDVAARANGGIVLLEYGRPADAAKLFAGLHADRPGDPLFAYYLGRCRVLAGRPAEAVPLLEPVAAAVDASRVPREQARLLARAHLELGVARRELGRQASDPAARAAAWEGARRELERYTALAPRDAEGWHRLGRLLYADLGRPYDAVAPLEKAYALDPVCDEPLRLLIRIAGANDPPPTEGDAEAARRAWTERRLAWERALEAGADGWREERKRRAAASRDGSDGCP